VKPTAVPKSLADAPQLGLTPAEFSKDADAARRINEWLGSVDAATRVRWALANLPGPFAMSSSFGAQAAVSLHLVTRADPRIPVILIDTGYLFPETHQFIDQLARQLSLDIKRFSSPQSVAEFEAQYGKLWEKGREGLDQYLELRKVEPMRRALKTLGTQTWFLRRDQSPSRAGTPKLGPDEGHPGTLKCAPLADWSEKDVWRYIIANEVPYNELHDRGYSSIGCTTCTQPGSGREGRWAGSDKTECGLHG